MSKHINAKIGLAYLEGRLDAAQRAKLERHLADCPECQAQLQDHQAMHNLLQATGQDFNPEPSGIPHWEAVRPQPQKQTIWRYVSSGGGRLILAGAAVLVLLTFVWQLRSAVPVFEPAASGFATTTPTPEAKVSATSPASVQTDATPPATTLPELFPTGTALTDTIESAAPVTLPQPILGSEVSGVSLNPAGRAAFVVDGTLFVETAVSTNTEQSLTANTYTAIAHDVLPQTVAWSPDGQELLFFSQPDDAQRPFLIHWQAQSGQLTPLSELINRPLPETRFTQVHWSENGRELLLTTSGQLTPDSEWDAGIWLANLDDGRLNLIVEALSLVDATWLNANAFILELDCGENCTILMAYDSERNLLWKAYAEQSQEEILSDLYVHQPAAKRIVHINTYNRPQTVDMLDTETGEIDVVWTMPDGMNFTGTQPYLSPNGRLLIFQIAGENGQIVTQVLDTETGEAETAVFPHASTAIQAGAWNPAGDIFSYTILNPGDNASHIYLWHVANDTKELINTADTTTIQNFVWTGDGERLFFNDANQESWQQESWQQELWQYKIASGELQRVAGP